MPSCPTSWVGSGRTPLLPLPLARPGLCRVRQGLAGGDETGSILQVSSSSMQGTQQFQGLLFRPKSMQRLPHALLFYTEAPQS